MTHFSVARDYPAAVLCGFQLWFTIVKHYTVWLHLFSTFVEVCLEPGIYLRECFMDHEKQKYSSIGWLFEMDQPGPVGGLYYLCLQWLCRLGTQAKLLLVAKKSPWIFQTSLSSSVLTIWVLYLCCLVHIQLRAFVFPEGGSFYHLMSHPTSGKCFSLCSTLGDVRYMVYAQTV